MSTPKLSQRVSLILPSASISLFKEVNRLRDLGEDIIGMHMGEPDFSTPPEVIQATKDSLDNNDTKYSSVPGIPRFRNDLANDFSKTGTKANAKNIFIANGSKHILYLIFQTILNPGDEVIIPIPYWVSFPEAVKLAGGIPVLVESCSDYSLDIDKIKEATSNRTKIILINTPNNPTGVIYNQKNLQLLYEHALKNDILIVADQAYKSFVYEGEKFIQMSSFEKEPRHILTVQSFSKSFYMTGFRVGYVIAHEKIIHGLSKIQGHLSGNTAPFIQFAAMEALKMEASIIQEQVKIFQKRRDIAIKLCNQKFQCKPPSGGFYLFPSILNMKERFSTSEELAFFLLTEAKVAVLPGSAYGLEGHLRLSYTISIPRIKEAFSRINKVL